MYNVVLGDDALLTCPGNVYVSNALVTTNIIAVTETLTGANGQTTLNVTGNVYVSNNLVIGPSPTTLLANLHVERGDVFIGNSAVTGTISNSGAASVNRLIFDNSQRNTLVPNKIVMYSNTASGNVCGLSVLGTLQTDVPYIMYQGGGHYFLTKSTSSISGYQAMIISPDGQLNLSGSSSRAHLDISNGNIPSSNIQVRIDSSNIALVTNGGLVGFGTLTPSASLHVIGNVYASNALTTTNVLAVTETLTGTTGQTTLNVTGNVYASNALTTTNVLAATETLTGTSGQTTLNVTGNVYASNALTTTNVLAVTETLTGITGVTTLNVTGNVYVSNALTTTNVLAVTETLTGTSGATTLNVTGNVYVSNALTTTNVLAATETLTGTSGATTLNVTGNVYVSNALTTTNVLAVTETLTGITGATTLNVTGNVYVSNALTTTNLTCAGFTSNVSNTTFNFDTFTIPFIYSTTLNVASTSNLQIVTLTGTTGATTLNVTGNIYVSNALTTTNVFAATETLTGTTGQTTLNITGNVYVSNALTTTNVLAATETLTGTSGQTTSTITGNVYVSNALTTTNVFATSVVPTYPISFRNRIINGDFIIDQRNGGASSTPGSGATRVIDRWNVEIFGSGRCLVGQNLGSVISPSGFTSYYGMRVTTTTTPGSGDYFFIQQTIEGINTVDL
ncbi:hypothetical protein EBT25_09820, partial [bacterium]|nr:hypothetical protein [bacterium]